MEEVTTRAAPTQQKDTSQNTTNQNPFPVVAKQINIVGDRNSFNSDLLFGVINRTLEKKNFPFLLTSKSYNHKGDMILEEHSYQTAHYHQDLSQSPVFEKDISSVNCQSAFLQWLLALNHMQCKHMISFCEFSLDKLGFEVVTKDIFKDGIALYEIYASTTMFSRTKWSVNEDLKDQTLLFRFCLVDEQNRTEGLSGYFSKVDITDGSLIWRFKMDHRILFDERLISDKFKFTLREKITKFKTLREQQYYIRNELKRNSTKFIREFPSPESYFISDHVDGSRLTHVPYGTDVWRLAVSIISLCCWKHKDFLRKKLYGEGSYEPSWKDPGSLFMLHKSVILDHPPSSSSSSYSNPRLKDLYSELITELTLSLKEEYGDDANEQDAVSIVGMCILQHSMGNGLLPDDSILECYKDSKLLKILNNSSRKIPQLLYQVANFKTSTLVPLYATIKEDHGNVYRFQFDPPEGSELKFSRNRSRNKNKPSGRVLPCHLVFESVDLFDPVSDVIKIELGTEGFLKLRTLMQWDPYMRFKVEPSFLSVSNLHTMHPSLLTILSSPYFNGRYKITPEFIEQKGYSFPSDVGSNSDLVRKYVLDHTFGIAIGDHYNAKDDNNNNNNPKIDDDTMNFFNGLVVRNIKESFGSLVVGVSPTDSTSLHRSTATERK